MTTLAHRSALRRPGNGGVAARRAVVRWAWRLFRREWRQQLLVAGAPHRRGRGRDRQHHGRLQHEPRRRRRVRLGQPRCSVRRLRSADARAAARRRPRSRSGRSTSSATARCPCPAGRDGRLPGAGPARPLRRAISSRSARAATRPGPARSRVTDGVADAPAGASWGRRSRSTGGAGPSSASSRTRAS